MNNLGRDLEPLLQAFFRSVKAFKRHALETVANPRGFFEKMRADEKVFLKRVVILMSGSVFAQALPIFIAPLLSRLFSPEEIGRFGLYAAAVSIGSVFVNLRYDPAILLPNEDADAASLVCLGLGFSLFFSLLLGVLLWANGDQILSSLGLGSISSMWFVLPLGFLCSSAIGILSSWSIRMVRFSNLAISRISQSASTATLQIGFSVIKASAPSLVLGQILGQVVGIVSLARQAWFNDKAVFAAVDFTKIKNSAYAYRRFPIFSLPADLSNSLGAYVPLFVLGSFFSPTVVGLYALTQRVLAAPVALVGNNVLEVFRERAASDYRQYGNCRDVYQKTFIALFLLGLPPSLILYFFAPSLFEFVFGPSWRESGEYARLLAPMLLGRFVATPLNYVLHIMQKQNVDLIWRLGFLAISFLTIYAGWVFGSPRLSIQLLSAGLSFMYATYIGLSYWFAKGTMNEAATCS